MDFTIFLVIKAHREVDIEAASDTKPLSTLFVSPSLHQPNLKILEGL